MAEAEVIFYYLTEDIRLRQCRRANPFSTDTVGYEVTDKEHDSQHMERPPFSYNQVVQRF